MVAWPTSNIDQSCILIMLSDAKLEEYVIDEKEVSQILLQVAVARREAEIVCLLNLSA